MCDLSFLAKEARSSPRRRLDVRLYRTFSVEKEPGGESESKKQCDENKENRRLDEYLNDQDGWNESVISGMSVVSKTRAVMFVSLTFNVHIHLNLNLSALSVGNEAT